MNDVDKLPSKCRDCAYWELAEEPYVCSDCESRTKQSDQGNGDCIKRSDALKAILGVSIYDTIEELEGARTIADNTWADGLYDAYKIIEEEVDAADVEPKQMWNPVSERPPKEHKEYLVVTDGGDPPGRYVTVWTYLPWCGKWAIGDDGFITNPEWDGVVTYWMEMPEPPKEEDDAEVR